MELLPFLLLVSFVPGFIDIFFLTLMERNIKRVAKKEI